MKTFHITRPDESIRPSYIRCEMTPTSVGGEQQISISGHS